MKFLSLRTTVLLLFAGIPHLLIADAPPNDQFADAIDLGAVAKVSTTGTLDEATVEMDEPFVQFDEWFGESIGSTIWWTWTCPAGVNRLVTVNTLGSLGEGYDPETFEPIPVPLDTLLMVFAGDQLSSLTPVAESDDSVLDRTSAVAFIATPGTTYRIRVDSNQWFPYNTSVELALDSKGAPVTADDHVAWGKARLTYTGGWTPGTEKSDIAILSAAALDAAGSHFQSARTLSSSHPEANVLAAVVTLLKLQKEPAFAALLAQIGIEDLANNADDPDYALPEDLDGNPAFADGATSGQALEYFKVSLRPRLQSALDMLGKVTSTTFLATFPDHTRVFDSSYIDYGDVLMLRGGFKAMLGFIDLLESYNLLAPLQDIADMNAAGTLNGQHLSDAFDSLLKFSGSDKRAGVKTNLQGAITLYNQGSTHIRTKRPLARDKHHLFPQRGNPEEEADIRANLDKISKSLGGTAVTESGWSFNLGKLLTGTLSLRDLAPNFKQNKVIKGSVLNPTLGGMLPGATLTKVQNFLLDENALYEGLLSLGAGVAPGHELFGSVDTPGGEFPANTSTMLSTTTNPGYRFAGWKFGNTLVSNLTPYTFPVIREYTLLAHFDRDLRDDDHDGLSNHDELITKFTNPENADTDGDGWPDGLDEQPTAADPRRFSVSQNLQAISLDLPVGRIVSISGLPPGVTYDAVNQRLVGRPNAIVGVTKSFPLKATVKPTTGASFQLLLSLTVEALPDGTVGTFSGLVSHHPLNQALGGTITATVTTSGRLTGKVTLAGKSYSFPANSRVDTTPGATATSFVLPALVRPKPLPPLRIELSFDSVSQTLTGSVEDTASGPVSLSGYRTPWSGANPATAYAATYNVGLAPADYLGNLAYPQGTGYAKVKVTTAGAVTWSGKLADGAAITGGTTLGPAGEVPLHLMLYTGTGSVQGWSKINNVNLDHVSPLNWTKKAQPLTSATRSYKAGFPTFLPVALFGSRYVNPPVPGVFTLLGLTEKAGNVRIDFAYGGLDEEFHQIFTVNKPSTVVMPATTALNPNQVKITVTPGTGLFSGSFKYGTPSRTALFSGAIIPQVAQGVVSFLLPETTAANSSILSGYAVVHDEE